MWLLAVCHHIEENSSSTFEKRSAELDSCPDSHVLLLPSCLALAIEFYRRK